MSASHPPRPEAIVLPSLPPSPSLLDEVFSHPRPWSVRHEGLDLQDPGRYSPGSAGSHPKGKVQQAVQDEDEEDEESVQHRVSTHEAYPPMSDEVAETRRVEETLKRWELAERQRRRLARESVQHASSPSLLSSVTRTANFVLSGGTAPVGKSHVSVDVAREGYAVPLDDIDRTRLSGDVVVHSPSPSPSIFDRSTSLDVTVTGTGRAPSSGPGTLENPFVHPSERTHPSDTPLLNPETPIPIPTPSLSPFADVQAQQAVQADPTARSSAESKTHAQKRSSGSRPPFVPPPRPLDLPPPPQDIPHVTPPQPTLQPVLRPPPPPPRREHLEERQEVRWWHDWLCGCGEGPDRGGDNQAGRTNPFE